MTYEVTKITNIDRSEEIVEKAYISHLGLVDDNEPYVIPVCFGYERGALYSHGSLKGQKAELTCPPVISPILKWVLLP